MIPLRKLQLALRNCCSVFIRGRDLQFLRNGIAVSRSKGFQSEITQMDNMSLIIDL